MKLAIAQINTTVGDFDGNVGKIRAAAGRADADIVVFPELAICGYMPRDLLEERSFLDRCERALDELAGLPPILVGAPMRSGEPGKPLVNAAVLLDGARRVVLAKQQLPTYDVFDEDRYFGPGGPTEPVELAGKRVGITICEDMWRGAGPVHDLVRKGAEVVVNLSASPYEREKPARRVGLARDFGVPFAMCNLVGANDQLIFDGGSFAVRADGGLCAAARLFDEDLVVTDFSGTVEQPADDVKDALVLGIRDYFQKTGFTDALIGMSGGVDSSLVACLAVEALGAGRVIGVGMPGPFSADVSLADARDLAERLNIRFHCIGIDQPYEVLCRSLEEAWGDTEFGLAEENLQARLRGTVLMSLANKWNALVLVPSNKSELAMGYCTLYGDMVGALAPISDLYKTDVYALAERYDMPDRIRTRPPSAELRPDQTDQDSLPPYDVLDGILLLHIEGRLPPGEIADRYDRDTVERVLRTVSRSEYKRQQGAPMLKVTPKAFDLGRRYPIVERFRGGT
jgi:NAD+ synthase (glutamine-hydrolysing)